MTIYAAVVNNNSNNNNRGMHPTVYMQQLPSYLSTSPQNENNLSQVDDLADQRISLLRPPQHAREVQAPVAIPAPAQVRVAAPRRPIPQQQQKRTSNLYFGCVLVATILVALIGVGVGSLALAYTMLFPPDSGSIKRTFPLHDTRRLLSNGNGDLYAVSLVNDGKVAPGYGYYDVASNFVYSKHPLDQNMKVVAVTSTIMAGARVSNGHIIVTEFTQSDTLIDITDEYKVSPSGVQASTLLELVHVRNATKPQQDMNKYYISVIFLGHDSNVYSLDVSYTYYSSDTISDVNVGKQPTLLYEPDQGFVFCEAVGVAISDYSLALSITHGSASFNQAATLVYLPDTLQVIKDDTPKQCQLQTVAALNETQFFTLCDSTVYYYTCTGDTTSLFYQATASISFTFGDTIAKGPYFMSNPSKGNYILGYVNTMGSLVAMLITPRMSEFDLSFDVSDRSTVAKNVATSVPFQMTITSNLAIFFTYTATNGTSYLMQTIAGPSATLSVDSSPTQIASSAPSNPITICLEPSSSNSGRQVLLVNTFPIFDGASIKFVQTEVIGGFHPIGIAMTSIKNLAGYTNVVLKGIVKISGIYSSLQTGQRYYFKRNGDLTTEDGDSVTKNKLAGLAISNTELLLSDFIQA